MKSGRCLYRRRLGGEARRWDLECSIQNADSRRSLILNPTVSPPSFTFKRFGAMQLGETNLMCGRSAYLPFALDT